MITARSIAAINRLSVHEKEAIYCSFIPDALRERFGLKESFEDEAGRKLIDLVCEAGSTDVILSLRHVHDAMDPVLYAHLTDTMNGQIHVLLYVVNDPASPRFDVDRMPNGAPTEFGVFRRNLAAEEAALSAGLAPGQIRSGLGILRESVAAFESFIVSLSHQIFFIEPLYYHNAIVFERYGFAYQLGRRLMEKIDAGFHRDGELHELLDGSSPFRAGWMADSIRGRSWALHDGIMGEPFTDVTMYKRIGEHAGITTFPNAVW